MPDRIELHTAGMTALPFEAGTFDLVVANVAMHNAKVWAGRKKAIEEAVRVLRPRGTVADRRPHVYAHLSKVTSRSSGCSQSPAGAWDGACGGADPASPPGS